MNNAACADPAVDPELFFPEDTNGRIPFVHAKRVCEACPIKDACLNVAMTYEARRRERWGIWGGLTPAERADLAKRRAA